MISPWFSSTSSKEKLIVNDSGRYFEINVEESIGSAAPLDNQKINIPSSTIGFIPLTDSASLLSVYDNNEYYYLISDIVGNCIHPLHIFNKSVSHAVTHLSEIMTNNKTLGKAAIFMISLPQIVFISRDGSVNSLAVDKRYKQWKSIFAKPLSLKSIEYFSGVASDEDHIFASFAAKPIGELKRENLESTL